MNIAFIVSGGLHPSGREQVIPTLLALLERLGRRHHVHAFSVRHLREAASYALGGVNVHDLGRPGSGKFLRRWNEWRALRTALAQHGPFDVIHGYWADPAGLLAVAAGRRLGVPSVVTCDSGEFVAVPDIRYGMQRAARTRALVSVACRLATRVHVATQYMQQLAAARGCDALQIPIGVDVKALSPSQSRTEGPPWRLLNVASLNRVKDHATLVDAFATAARRIDVRLDLVGEDTLNGAIQAHAARLGLADRLAFHGFRPFDELPAFYNAAHLYVQSSRHEAAGAAVMEAAACGVPIVGTRVGYVADWDAEAAVAVPPADAPALARAIVEALHDPARRAYLAAHARAFAETHDVDWTATELERLYASLLATEAPKSQKV
jgi:glycosyltransferase involved in cell wall biosynthesis